MMGSYAAIVIPTESNFQKSLSDTYKVIMELVRNGYEVYYSLKPFTVKVYELESTIRPYIRTFGLNTFIVKVYDKEEFEQVLDYFSGRVRANYTFDRMWVKGRKMISTNICAKNCLNTPIYEILKNSGFELSCDGSEASIQCYDELSYLFFKEYELLGKGIVEKKIAINKVQILKPWHTIVYGAKISEISEESIKQRKKILVYENMFADELIVALSDHEKIPLISVTENPPVICLNNVFDKLSLSFFRVNINSALYMLSYGVNVSV